MTESQKETLRFYTTNDYLLINGLLWKAEEETIDFFIRLINEDGRGVMAEAETQGYGVRWNCSREEGEALYRVYQRRFPVLGDPQVKDRILTQTRQDIQNMMSCMTPLEEELLLYRNVHPRFVEPLEEGIRFEHLGFSSCSLSPHVPEDASYGASDCCQLEITVPAGTPAIRMDRMPEVQNEPDEVILAPLVFYVTKVDKEKGKISMSCLQPLD